MSLSEEYQNKLVTPEEAVRVVKSGDWVDYGAFAGQVVALDKALAGRVEELEDVKIRTFTSLRMPEVVKVDPESKHFTFNNWHFSGIDRKLHDQGAAWYIPMLYHEVPGIYRQFLDVDVAMIPVTPMDEHGYFNFGMQVSAAHAVCEKAKIVILEVNPNMPKCLGGREESIHISEVDYIVEADWKMLQVPSGEPKEIEKKIASYILPLLEDGSCIQLGIGGMPNALGQMIAQSDLKDLGLHSEMFTESMVDMVESGRVTGARKNIDKFKVVYTFGFGTQKLYDFLHNNQQCAAYPVDYVNDPFIIAQNDKVASINNCIEIDLTGQVASESSGTRHISGTGGQFDFAFGSYHSKGGQSFMAMESTFKKGGELYSRIKPIITPGGVVTTHRAIVQYMATEYGIVNLKGKSTWERAEALISIAHPNFRDELIKEAEQLGIWRHSNKR